MSLNSLKLRTRAEPGTAASFSHTSSGAWLDTGITFTPKVSGRHLVFGSGNFAYSASGSRGFSLTDASNAEIIVADFHNVASGVNSPRYTLSGTAVLSKDITYKIRAFQSSGGTLDITGLDFDFLSYPDFEVLGAVKSSHAVFSVKIANTGTPTLGTQLGGTFVDSLTDDAVGRTTLNFKTDLFSAPPVCIAQIVNADAYTRVSDSTTSAVQVTTGIVSTTAFADIDFTIICMGLLK
jgi:hypothetical protein